MVISGALEVLGDFDTLAKTMAYSFEQTGLWRTSLGNEHDQTFSRERERLRSAFYSFRQKTEDLVSRIASALPSLTKHDITHLDELWGTAALIAGDSFLMNPLEGFVFGGAILLHDAALCFEAYPSGIDGIRSTVIWKDAYAAESRAGSQLSEEETKSNADFSALRSLHAREAASLAERAWEDPDTHDPIFLIENSDLRKHLGQLIGQIASSHHWDIEQVGSTFSHQVNAIPQFPREWRIDALKLACLLRCADAAHIDQKRAPDFLHALLHRKGVSFLHWQAQNRLARADLDISDETGSSLVFTSTRAFPISDAASWWIAFDAVCLVDKEISASNAMLESQNAGETRHAFRIKRVRGVESPERMAGYIQAEGWEPCSATLHVGNVEKLIGTLGGEQLYGVGADVFEIAIRELVQNARDAIQARRAVDLGFAGGEITIRLNVDPKGLVLSVEDNGVGMSRRVLTGPLLDFGSSFWVSALVREEFPGLRSSQFQPVGQFGIGFYSVFMIADAVKVISRRWDEGLSSVNQLVFDRGITLRPLLIRGKSESFRSDLSTQVLLHLKPSVISLDGKIQIKRNVMGGTNFFVDFADFLAALCSGLDVNVSFANADGHKKLVHRGQPVEQQCYRDWLQQISFSRYQDPSVAKYINENADRLRPIVDDGVCCGLAAILTRRSNTQDFLTVATVGGLATTVHHRGPGNYMGFIGFKPRSTKRDQGELAACPPAMQQWAKEQFRILATAKLDPVEQCVAAEGLAHFKVDPSPIMRVCVGWDGKVGFVNLQEITSILQSMDLMILKSKVMDFADVHNEKFLWPGRALLRPFLGGVFYDVGLDSGVPRESYSAAGCLHRHLLAQGMAPKWRIEPTVTTSPLFGTLDAVVLSIKAI